MTMKLAITAFAAAALTGTAMAQADTGETAAVARERLNRMPDTAGDGPFPSMIEQDSTLPGLVIYRPKDLSQIGPNGLGVVVWGNGGCADDGSSQRFHLAEIASYGYLVFAPGGWRSGPNAADGPAPVREPLADGSVSSPTTSSQLTQALDWALAENVRVGGKYYGLVDENALATAGFSCGGAQAMRIAGDPRLDTVVMQNSGLFIEEPPVRMAEMDLPKSALLKLHTPVLYLEGGPTDIAYDNALDEYRRIAHVPVYLVNRPTGHEGTYDQPMGGRNASIVVDWLEWQLRGNASAARTFVGANCRLCTDPEATIEMKNTH